MSIAASLAAAGLSALCTPDADVAAVSRCKLAAELSINVAMLGYCEHVLPRGAARPFLEKLVSKPDSTVEQRELNARLLKIYAQARTEHLPGIKPAACRDALQRQADLIAEAADDVQSTK